MNNATLVITSSWATTLPDSFQRIGISRGTPRNQSGFRVYRDLCPGKWFNSCASNEGFKSRYFEILGQLKAEKVVDDLIRLADGRVPVLLCWEPPTHSDEWCHRGLAAAWLHDELGLAVREYGHEGEGFGWSHPKLPSEFRRFPA